LLHSERKHFVAGKTNQLSFPFLGNETRKNKLSKFIQFNIPAVGASARQSPASI